MILLGYIIYLIHLLLNFQNESPTLSLTLLIIPFLLLPSYTSSLHSLYPPLGLSSYLPFLPFFPLFFVNFFSPCTKLIFSSFLFYSLLFFFIKLCFCVGVSGSLYCYIRGAPNYGIEERNVPRFFAGPGRDQYFIEGEILDSSTV